MQRVSIGSPGSRPSLDAAPAAAVEEADEKAARAATPDKSIHLVALLTLLCLLVLFLFSHDPAISSSTVADSPPVLAVSARSLEATGENKFLKLFKRMRESQAGDASSEVRVAPGEA